MKLAEMIRNERLDRHLTQEAFGELVGMSQEWVTKTEAGTAGTPRLKTIRQLSARLSIPLEDLYLATDIAASKAGAKRIAAETPDYIMFDPDLASIVDVWPSLTPDARDKIIEYMDLLMTPREPKVAALKRKAG